MKNKLKFQVLTDLAEAIIADSKDILGSYAESYVYKSDNDAVTSRDLALQAIIKSEIKKVDPQVPVYSEEDDLSSMNADIGWLVDPLDGTSNFLQGLKYQAISIAKLEKGEIQCALVIDLDNFDVYTAIKSAGAQLNGSSISINTPKIHLVGTSTGFVRASQRYSDAEIPGGINLRILGSQALQLCFVATGQFIGNVSLEAKAWDDVAGALIVREAGGNYSMCGGVEERWFEMAKAGTSLRSVAFGRGVNKMIVDYVERVFNV